jgi:hypothetical protein
MAWKLPPLPRPTPAGVKAWADAFRDLGAILYVPVVTLVLGVTTWLLVYGPWAPATQLKRLDALTAGYVLMHVAFIIGVLFYQRRALPNFTLKSRLGKVTLDTPEGGGVELTPTPGGGVAATVTPAPTPTPDPSPSEPDPKP